MAALRRFARLSWRDRFLFVEATVLLAFSALCIALLPFARVAGIAARRPRALEPAPAQLARRIGWTVEACARRVPWRALCFERGLAAQRMLHRRGFKALLCYGIRPDTGEGLAAHVWVRSGDVDVTGCENIAEFGLVASFGD